MLIYLSPLQHLREIPTWGLAKKELWNIGIEVDFFFFSIGLTTQLEALWVNKYLLSTHTREWHCYAMSLKGIYTLLSVWKLTFTGWKILPYIWTEYRSESNSLLDDFNTARFYVVDKSGLFFFWPDLKTVTKEKIIN